VLSGQIKGLKFSHSQFFGFIYTAGPKAGQKHELCVKFSGIRTGTHNLEVAGTLAHSARTGESKPPQTEKTSGKASFIFDSDFPIQRKAGQHPNFALS
jgi:hypothetical protein